MGRGVINRIMIYAKGITISPFLKFCIVGSIGVLINTAILVLLYDYVHLPLIAASIGAISTAMLSNFLMNDRWTFKERSGNVIKGDHRVAVFVAICSVGMLINIIVLNALVYIGIWFVAANLVGIASATGWNYLSNRHITWG